MRTRALGRLLPASARGLPAAFWWIWTSTLINWLGAFAGPLLALYLTNERERSPAYAGFVVSLIGLGSMAGTTLGGHLADRIGRRRTMFGAHCWTALNMVLLGLAEDGWALALAAFAVGLGSAAARPAMSASVADLLPAEDRRRAFALHYWAINAGLAVSAVLAGLMVRGGYLPLFLADAGATLLCAAVVLVKVPETRPTARETTADGPPPPASTPVRRDRPFLLFVVLTLLFASVYEQCASTLPVAMSQDGHSPATYSLMNALNGVLIVAFQIPLSRLARKGSPRLVLTAGAVLVGWGFGLAAFVDSALAYACTVVVWTTGEMLQAPTAIAVAAARAPEDQRGRYQGMYGMAWSAAAFLAPAGGGLLLDRWGATVLWSVCAVTGTVAGVGWALVTGRLEPAPAPAAPSAAAPPRRPVPTERELA
ncbi:MFS transporter [Streptomyces xanthochromogenes]|uniref:MDR family MFS transporter n=1 Tax=Streptomyces xanthochromogenes TaxID=67384 RepID=UPI00341F6DA4